LLVRTHFGELDGPARGKTERYSAREQGVDQGASAQLDPFDLP